MNLKQRKTKRRANRKAKREQAHQKSKANADSTPRKVFCFDFDAHLEKIKKIDAEKGGITYGDVFRLAGELRQEGEYVDEETAMQRAKEHEGGCVRLEMKPNPEPLASKVVDISIPPSPGDKPLDELNDKIEKAMSDGGYESLLMLTTERGNEKAWELYPPDASSIGKVRKHKEELGYGVGLAQVLRYRPADGGSDPTRAPFCVLNLDAWGEEVRKLQAEGKTIDEKQLARKMAKEGHCYQLAL